MTLGGERRSPTLTDGAGSLAARATYNGVMFFRRATPHQFDFEERLQNLKSAGFDVQKQGLGSARVTRGGCGAILEDEGAGQVKIGKAGVLIGNEIGMLVSRGYQMFLRTPAGREVPAQASHLHKLHEFDEDLRESLGLTSLYNVSLGTTTDEHLYDRVEDRDAGEPHRPWEK
jgi:hypothetical protein